ncbi:MAG TPA: DUF721 domain-containing protein [Fimbriimonadaceae bacterium]|nr:DUF721 domain-containing protein [Fimbriimonadaceae bacterium]
MKRLDDWMAQAVEQKEVLRAGRAQIVLKEWPGVVGELLAAKSTPERFERGTLWVAATGSAWAQELRFMQDTILERLNRLAGEPDLFLELRVGARTPRRDLSEPAEA